MSRSIEQAFMLMSTFECVFVIKSESPWLVSLLVFFSQCIQMLFLKMDFWAICLQKNTNFILVYSPFLLILLVSKITAQSHYSSGRHTHWSFVWYVWRLCRGCVFVCDVRACHRILCQRIWIFDEDFRFSSQNTEATRQLMSITPNDQFIFRALIFIVHDILTDISVSFVSKC